MSEDDGKGKWVWGALGIAAGVGLAYWLLRRKGLVGSSPELPAQVAPQQPDTGTEGLMAGYSAQAAQTPPRPARTTDIVDAEFEALPEDQQEF
jgi:hypothetical protein